MKKEDFIYLIYKEYKGSITSDEQDYLQYWLSADQANRKMKEEILLSMNMLDDYVPSFDIDLEDEFESMQSKMSASSSSSSSSEKAVESEKNSKIISLRKIMYAAAMIAVVMGALIVFTNGNDSQVEYLLASTELGEKKDVTLSDGSMVWLNENSSIRYPNKFSDSGRELELTGEAFFEIKKDATRPFRVSTNQSITTVLGTSFNIKAEKESGNTRIVVKTGKVRFESKTKEQSTLLLPYEAGLLNYQEGEINKESVNDLNDISWHSGTMSFRSKSVKEILEVLEDRFEVEIDFDNVNIKDCKTNILSVGASVHEVLETMKNLHGIEYKSVGKRIFTVRGGHC